MHCMAPAAPKIAEPLGAFACEAKHHHRTQNVRQSVWRAEPGEEILAAQPATAIPVTLTQTEAMGLTLMIEGATAAALAPALARASLAAAAAAVAASCLTHPILWAIYWDATHLFGALTTPALEAAIIATETLAYRAVATPRWDEAALLSLLVNAASWGAGEALYALG